MSLVTSCSTGLLLALLAPAPLSARAQPPDQRLLEEKVLVVEVPILVELPPGTRPDPDELMVREGERLLPVRDVTRLEDERWQVLVYLDAVLADSETSFHGLLSLARRAEDLVGLGPVTLMVADPEPEVILDATEEDRLLLEALAALAGRRLGRDGVVALRRELAATPPEARTTEVLEGLQRREVETVIRQLDGLSRATAERCPGPPCLLILVSNGFFLQPEATYGAEGSSLPEAFRDLPGQRLARATDALEVELASGGWTLLAVPFRRLLDLGPSPPPGTEYDAWATGEGLLVPPGRLRRDPPRRHQALPIETLDYLTLPRFAPLRRLSEATGGSLARAEQELDTLLAGFARRWLVWYAREIGPEPLPPQPLEVLDLPSGSRLRAPAWSPPATREGRPGPGHGSSARLPSPAPGEPGGWARASSGAARVGSSRCPGETRPPSGTRRALPSDVRGRKGISFMRSVGVGHPSAGLELES